jgi:hypothetical protein
MGLKGNGKWAMHTKTCKGIRRVLKAHAASFSVRMLLSLWHSMCHRETYLAV